MSLTTAEAALVLYIVGWLCLYHCADKLLQGKINMLRSLAAKQKPLACLYPRLGVARRLDLYNNIIYDFSKLMLLRSLFNLALYDCEENGGLCVVSSV